MTKEMKEVESILEQYEGKKENLKRKSELLVEMRKRRGAWDRNVGIGSAAYDQLPANNNKVNSTVAQIAIKNIELELEIEEEIEYLSYQVNVIEKVLDDLRGASQEIFDIVKAKTIEKKKWRCVAYELGIGDRSAQRKFSKGIEMIYRLVGEERYKLLFLKYEKKKTA